MSAEQVSLGADADSNFAATGNSLGIGQATNSDRPRVSTGPVNKDAKAYVTSTGDAAEESTKSPVGDGLTSYGNTDTHAEAGAAGSDITASSGYGSKKAPDEQAGQGLGGGLHRPDYLSKGEQIPSKMGVAPRSDREAAARDEDRQQKSQLQGSYTADDIAKLEKSDQQS